MRISSLAIPIIAHGAKFSSAQSDQGSNPHPINLTSIPHMEEKIVLPNTYVARPVTQARIAADKDQTTKAFSSVLYQELNSPNRNAGERVDTKGRKLQSSDWAQLGLDINGKAGGDQSGYSVSLSSDGSMLAVGAPYSDSSSGQTDAGHVRVFKFNGTGWTQLGLDIDGEATSNWSGWSVSLSGDGSILAVGATRNSAITDLSNAGHVRVFKFNGTDWTQLGLDIDGEAAFDNSGSSISLSKDGSVLAIGAPNNDPNGRYDVGHARVYKFNGTDWTQLGLDIDGEAVMDYSGSSVSLSSDGSVLAVGAKNNDLNGLTNVGHVRVYKFNGTGWTQLGLDIDGEVANEYSGSSVSLSSDGGVLAVGAPWNDPSGLVRVYKFNGTSWTQLGLDIDGEAADGYFGGSISLSSNGIVLAVGAQHSDANGHIAAGLARVYTFNGTDWTQLGLSISGRAARDYFGRSISLSGDGSVLAVGAPENDSNGRTNAGHVRVYRNNALLTTNSLTSTPSKPPSAMPTRSPSKPPSNAPSLSPSIPPSSKLDIFREKSINSTCVVKHDTFLLECSASVDVLVAGVFKTSLVQGTCTAGNPPTEESLDSSIDLAVNVACKNSGTCNHTHCFRADFVVEGVRVLSEMLQVVSAVTFEKDGSFSVEVETSDFTAINERTNTTVAANVTATLGECGSTSKIGEALQMGDTAVICISSFDNVKLSLKSVTANPGDQVLVNEVGDPNFLTTVDDNAYSVTLRTLMIPVYFDAQGGDSGSIVIEGTAEISYTARHLSSGPRYPREVEEALFGLEVPLVGHVNNAEVAQMNVEDGNFGCVVGWSNFIPLVIVGAVFVMV